MPTEFQLQIEELILAFRSRTVLQVSRFDLPRGAKVLITGESGSGKSVFLRALLGLLPADSVKAGTFRWCEDGREQVMDYRHHRRRPFLRERVSLLFQDAINSLHPYRAIAEQCPVPATGAERDLYREFHLDPEILGSRMPRECSGGECQRLSLLFPYFNEQRDLLVLDEPLTDIDWISRENIESCLKRFLGEEKRTVVLVTHQPHWLPQGIMAHYAIEKGILRRAPSPKGVRRPVNVSEYARTDRPPVLSLRVNAPFVFPTSRDRNFVLRPLEIGLGAGEGIGMIGESGSGKSTLLRIAAGLFPRTTYRGRFSVALRFSGNGLDPILSAPRSLLYRRIQLVQQNTSGTLFDDTVVRNLQWIRRRRNVKPERFKAVVSRWGQALGLFADPQEMSGTRLSELSVGMLRRYLLLRAFLLLDIYNDQEKSAHPKVLLLDEISRGLDAENLERLAEVLRAFRQEHGVSIIAVSHDLDFIRENCDRFQLMFRGLLLPRNYSARDLEGIEDNRRLQEILNPYYYDFLARREGTRRRTAEPGFGCLYNRYFECPNSGAPGCQHRRLQSERKVAICI